MDNGSGTGAPDLISDLQPETEPRNPQDRSRWLKPVCWPEGRRFAFTIFDDPDAQSLEASRLVYGFLSDLGFRTTISVWPLAAGREANSEGETCANPAYVDH